MEVICCAFSLAQSVLRLKFSSYPIAHFDQGGEGDIDCCCASFSSTHCSLAAHWPFPHRQSRWWFTICVPPEHFQQLFYIKRFFEMCTVVFFSTFHTGSQCNRAVCVTERQNAIRAAWKPFTRFESVRVVSSSLLLAVNDRPRCREAERMAVDLQPIVEKAAKPVNAFKDCNANDQNN